MSCPKCETGCMHYTGGEIKHHEECVYYPDSLTRMNETRISNLEQKLADSQAREARYKEALEHICRPVMTQCCKDAWKSDEPFENHLFGVAADALANGSNSE